MSVLYTTFINGPYAVGVVDLMLAESDTDVPNGVFARVFYPVERANQMKVLHIFI
jgi:hypothetical protein